MEIKENEIWKDIIGCENLYQVSSLGRVKSLGNSKTWNKKERILKQKINKNGYCCVTLYKEGKPKYYLVHCLVCTAFIPNPQNYPQVNHKDEVKTNNCVNNLEWVTQKYNSNYGTRNERVSKANKGRILSQEWKNKISKANKGRVLSQEHIEKCAKSRQKPILQFNKQGTKILGKWDSAQQVERELNIFATSIAQCCKGKRKSCGGYRWMYLEDYVNRMEKLYQLTLKKAS